MRKTDLTQAAALAPTATMVLGMGFTSSVA